MNYAHRVHLLEAELARVLGRHAEARDHYDRAIRLARQNRFLNDVALASELAGRYFDRLDMAHLARAYLRDAHAEYRHWGAHALARQLATAFPQYLADAAANTPQGEQVAAASGGPVVDLRSVLEASRAISGEMELEPLLRRLMQVVMENSGARRVCLALERNGQLFVEAEVTVGAAEVALRSVPIDTLRDGLPLLPLRIVNFVIHTQDSVLLDDALADPRFNRDPYVMRTRPHSVLCAPLLRQGRLTGVIYLENEISRGVFTPARLGLLNHVVAQAAISVDNVRLYDDVRTINSAYQRFVPQQFLGILGRSDITEVTLGDRVEREMTVLFADLRQFTQLTQRVGLERIFTIVNRYLGQMVPAVEAHEGIVDKFVGDAIMALFPRQADDALHAAIAMLRSLAELNAALAAEGQDPLWIGIGLHYGKLMMGTVGVPGRMDATVIGDAVNVASRIQGLTRHYGLPLILTSDVRDRLEFPARFDLREIDRVRVKGRAGPVDVFEAFDTDTPEMRFAKRRHIPLLAELTNHYRQGRFAAAASCARVMMQQVPDDMIAGMYLARCEGAASAPANWDGTWAAGML
jgi:class 3 adenylate cyclase/GAF domain-containing protein